MRKNILVIVFVICMTLLCSCGSSGDTERTSSESTTQVSSVPFELEELYDDSEVGVGQTYFRDSVTDVMYIWRWSGSRGALAEMSDPETGKPLTYARYKELATQKTE